MMDEIRITPLFSAISCSAGVNRRNPRNIRIAALGTSSDYFKSLLPLIVESLGYKIRWTSPISADLLVYGPFYDPHAPRMRWMPRPWRYRAALMVDAFEKALSKRKVPPLTLFQTAENLRHDYLKTDFSISYDLNVGSENHYRLPYWMEMIDWSHEGISGNTNPRYGELIKIERLRSPLGDQFLRRAHKAILITSHLREPRASAYNGLQKILPVEGLGPYFNKDIKDHHSSRFKKSDILKQYAFNLCPENSISPGYVTEKIPEAFAAGCLPITVIDESVSVDFNPEAIINLVTDRFKKFESLQNLLHSQSRLSAYASEPLLANNPSITGLKKFIKNMVESAL